VRSRVERKGSGRGGFVWLKLKLKLRQGNAAHQFIADAVVIDLACFFIGLVALIMLDGDQLSCDGDCYEPEEAQRPIIRFHNDSNHDCSILRQRHPIAWLIKHHGVFAICGVLYLCCTTIALVAGLLFLVYCTVRISHNNPRRRSTSALYCGCDESSATSV
jgi:hypothetical protein